jgi:hypothetical protein
MPLSTGWRVIRANALLGGPRKERQNRPQNGTVWCSKKPARGIQQANPVTGHHGERDR